MAVTITASERIDTNVWRVTWAQDGVIDYYAFDWYTWKYDSEPTFYVYINGTLVSITTATSQLVTVRPGTYAVVEVFDDALDAPSEQWPDNVLLSWTGLPDVAHYRVEQYISSTWTEVDKVYPNVKESYLYRSASLADVTTHQFRVIAVGANGEESNARTWSILMVRRPDTPELDYAYDDETNTVTLSV